MAAMKIIPRHQCMIYAGSPAPHLPSLAALVRQKLNENYRCLYLNSPPMVAGMRSYLFAAGVDVTQEVNNNRLMLSSSTEHLEKRHFDVDRMITMLNEALTHALRDVYQGLWATGDMSWEFGPEKDFSKLLEYEWRLEELFQRNPCLSGICQYHTDTLPHRAVRQGLLTHQSILINHTLSRLNAYYIERDSARIPSDIDLDHVIAGLSQAQDTH